MYDVFMYMFFAFAGRFSVLFGSGHRTILTLHELLAVRFEDHLRALTSVSSHESVYDVARSSLTFDVRVKSPTAMRVAALPHRLHREKREAVAIVPPRIAASAAIPRATAACPTGQERRGH